MPRALRILRLLFCSVTLSVSFGTAVWAQALQPPTVPGPLRDGDTTVLARFPDGATSNSVDVRIDATDTTIQTLPPRLDGQMFRVRLKVVLRAGQSVELRYSFSGQWSPWSKPTMVEARHPNDIITAYLDDDSPFIAEAFYGLNLDNFATSEAKQAAGVDTTTVNTKPRMTSGFNLYYRLYGHSHSNKQVWIFSRLSYATRSGEALCTNDPNASQTTCLFGQQGTAGTNQVFKTIEHANSVEVINGVRWDVATLEPASNTPTKFYFLAELGPFLLAGADNSANEWMFGGGLRIPSGTFRDTKVDIGVGGSDYFARRFPRFKVDGYLGFPVAGPLRFFAEIRTDANFDALHGGKEASVSLITILGFHLEVSELFK